MRKLIAILVICILPIQWSFAAVAEYCQHEVGVAAQNHLGHHAHEHVDKHVDESQEGKSKKSAMNDVDCPACCHSTGATIFTLSAATIPRNSAEPVTFHFQRIPYRSPDNPFRPPLATRL